MIWPYYYSATLWTLRVCGIVIFVSSRRCALHAGGQLLPLPIIALRSRLSSRPPARPSSSLSVLLCFALFAPVSVQKETSQFSPPFSLFPALLFPFPCFWPPVFLFLRRRRIRAAGELLRFLFPFRFVRADSTTSAHCASDGFFLVSVVIWGVSAVGLEKVNRYCSLLITLGNPAVCSRSKFPRSIGVFRPGFGSLSPMSFLLFAAVLCDIPVDVSSCFRIGWIG